MIKIIDFSNQYDLTKLLYKCIEVNDNHSQLNRRMIMTKTISFAIVHFSVAFTVGYVMTGSILVGGTMALIEPAINTVAFYMHEKVWTAIKQNNAERNPAIQ